MAAALVQGQRQPGHVAVQVEPTQEDNKNMDHTVSLAAEQRFSILLRSFYKFFFLPGLFYACRASMQA